MNRLQAINGQYRVLGVVLIIFAHLFVLSNASLAQSASGFPFASIGGGPFDTINMANLNVHFNIPIVNKAGRGLPFSYSLGYNSTVFAVISSPTSTNVQQSFIHSNQWGWTTVGSSPGFISSSQVPCVTAPPFSTNPPTAQGNFTYTDSNGTAHPFPSSLIVSSDSSCAPLQGTADATDQSGFTTTVTYSSAVVQDIGGDVINAPNNAFNGNHNTITDPNGNMISVDQQGFGELFTDTMGTPVLTTVSTRYQPNATTISTTYTYNAPGGTERVDHSKLWMAWGRQLHSFCAPT